MLKISRGFVLVAVVMVFGGCSGMGDKIHSTAIEVEQKIIVANDFQVRVSQKGLCSSALTALLRAYGANPDQFYSVLHLCGVSNENKSIILDSLDTLDKASDYMERYGYE